MEKVKFSPKGEKLIQMYADMASKGYDTADSSFIDSAFNDFELRAYRDTLKPIFSQYFDVDKAFRYEPARQIDERKLADCVTSFDVLEHVFISDIPNVIRDILSYAKKLVIVNVACYPARALLPNGENAHITVRPPLWWKGMFDSIAVEYPNVDIYLLCSEAHRQINGFEVYSANRWQSDDKFVIDY